MISLTNITKKLSEFTLGPISIEIDPTNIYCFKGESGSGKSTILRILNLQLKQTDGTIKVDGSSYHGNEILTYRSNHILLEQLPHADHEDTVLDYLKFPFNFNIHSANKFNEEHIKNMFAKVSLKTDLNKKFRLLSSGEKQRVQLVRGLSLNPTTVILDEAFNAIDPKNLGIVWDYLLELNKSRKLGIIYTSHNPTEERYSEIVFNIDQGKIVTNNIDE